MAPVPSSHWESCPVGGSAAFKREASREIKHRLGTLTDLTTWVMRVMRVIEVMRVMMFMIVMRVRL